MVALFSRFVLLAFALLPIPVLAADLPETARVYTNSDLFRLGPAPASPSQPVAASSLDWVDLDRFLERQYARIDADRRHDLDRLESERRDLLARSAAREKLWIPSSVYWGAGWGGAPYGYLGDCATKTPDRPKGWGDLAGRKTAGGGAGKLFTRRNAHVGGRRR